MREEETVLETVVETAQQTVQETARHAGVRQLRFERPAGATELLLIRHGESAPYHEDNPHPLLDGQGDPELAPLGRLQAERVAARLAGSHIDAIYCSTLRRTAETAAPLAALSGLTPLVDADLREVHLGAWEGGEFRSRVMSGDPLAVQMLAVERWDVIPGAESNESLQARILASFGRMTAAHAGGRVAVFAHGGVIGTALSMASHASAFAFAHVDNCSISKVVIIGDRWVVRSANDTCHLEKLVDERPAPLEATA